MDESLRQQLSELSEVVGLKEHPAWKVIMRDAQANFDAISYMWFEYEEGSKELKEARARQIANKTILTLMDLYTAKLQEIGMEVIETVDNKNLQTTDVESGIIEDGDE